MPRAAVLWRTYQKRYLARTWQAAGLRILVDLNVAAAHFADAILGVPAGWRAFATRGYSREAGWILEQADRARAIAEADDILFVVYGGGADIQTLAGREGWIWIPEQRDTAQGKYQDESPFTGDNSPLS